MKSTQDLHELVNKNINQLNRQQRIFRNKVIHGFNITDIETEIDYLKGEVIELEEAHRNSDIENLLEELADICIMAYGIAEIAGRDLDKEIENKMRINEKRIYYKDKDGNFHKVAI